MSALERESVQPWDGRVVDVAVVGLGPVGQTLTAQLGKLGHDVVAVERWPEVFPLPRAGHIDHEIMRVLQSLSVADAIDEDAWKMSRFELHDRNGEVLFSFNRSYEGVSGWHSGYSMFQPYLERLLQDQALACPGVTHARGWEVEHVAQGDEYATLRLRNGEAQDGVWHPGDTTSEIRARYVVGCDGAHSVVRRSAGIEMTDFGFEADWLVVFAEPQDRSQMPDMADVAQLLDPSRPAFAFRASGKRFCRWEFRIMPGEDPVEMGRPEVAWKLIEKWGLTPQNARLVRNSVFRFRSLVADRWREGRSFLAGDAAHLMPPFLGQGLCSGVRDATALTWKLDLVLRGASAPTLLESYEAERKPHATTVVQNSLLMGELNSVTDPDEAERRDEALRSGSLQPPTPAMPSLIDGVLLRGEDGAVVAPAGVLSMQPRVRIGEQLGRLDDLVGNGWLVLATGFDPESALGPEEHELVRSLDARLLRVETSGGDGIAVAESGAFAEWLADANVDAVIVRPDFYVFAGVRGKTELGAALRALGAQLRLTAADRSTAAR